ncbi:putative dynamin GTPase [Zopfia rhizophila CBS 207.26]|uniref:Putative dynamin GTPase n=1 Tax=Zopfia rhizophila CBS 207.26 TaxID=1314779 RepID=A0A6A6ECU6_9PEZI|nr:putative dynamin GTPase [Zopfia rhizophila CBS 207.26]
MANVSSEESALRQLQSEQSELLDVIDGLRNLGLGRLIELPQLIVCGDQSCGKSSVLEAISRVRFPVKGGVCTRFATEVILRRSPSPKVAVTIEPGESRTNEEERERLRKFSEHISTATGLPELIEAAKEWMGISSADGPNAGFSDDILKVEIMGPDKPELTLVDLPGLYHSKSREQGTEGIPVVRKLVEKYMSNTRSIILAIISAKSDYNLQEILDLAERYDGKLERTLGIVTKPDTLEANSSEEEIYIEHINNERVKLQLGWHTLKNRNYETRDASDETRDDLERAFFSTGRWTNISREFVGIDALRQRLSGVLLHHIKRHLPGLINDIENKIQDRKSKLVKLGEERSTLRQQRRYLLETSRLFEKIVGQAVNGMYLDRFFGGLYSTSAPDETRLRAVIRDLNEEFAINMRLNGCRRRIVDEASGKSVCAARARDSPTIWIGAPINSEPETIARGDLEREINERARKNRGIELPGNPNQLLVGDLFRDQSKPWERLAREHLLAVWAAVKQFVKLLLIRLTDNSTSPLLLRNILEPELEKMQENMLTKLDELIAYNKRGHPLPFDQTYLTMTRKLQSDRQLALLEKTLLEMYPEAFEPQGKKRLSIQEVRAAVSEARPASDQFGATEVIELMETYYDIAITTFIDNVAILAIENCLVQPLETIFTPLTVEAMEDHEVMRLASEPPYAQANRLQLRSDLDKLTAGLRSCNRYNTQRACE